MPFDGNSDKYYNLLVIRNGLKLIWRFMDNHNPDFHIATKFSCKLPDAGAIIQTDPSNPMSQKEKLIKRFLGEPRDFTWDELIRLLKILGYREFKTGKTGGSRRRFVRDGSPPITLHKPHPGNIVKLYIIRELIEFFRRENQL